MILQKQWPVTEKNYTLKIQNNSGNFEERGGVLV